MCQEFLDGQAPDPADYGIHGVERGDLTELDRQRLVLRMMSCLLSLTQVPQRICPDRAKAHFGQLVDRYVGENEVVPLVAACV